ncbi:MAG: ABC transporter permease [Actinobacteria bacterium]|nr:ABC transporter permease [Actinomycetota bacterium]
MRSRLRPIDLFALSMRGLFARPFRAVLTSIGIGIGIAAIVAVIGISASGRAALLATLDDLGTNLLRVTPGAGIFGQAADVPEDAVAMVARIGPVEDVTGITIVDATVRRSDFVSKLDTGGLTVVSATPRLLEVIRGDVADGRFLEDGLKAVPVVVLGSTAAERLGIRSVVPAVRVLIGDEWFGVTGILESFPIHPDLDRTVFVSYESAATFLDGKPEPTAIYVRANPLSINDVAEVIPATVAPEAPDTVEITRPSDALVARKAADETLTSLLIGLGAVALLVAGVAIANIMVMSILERRMEIGVRRSLGATRRHIRLQFIVESMALAGFGGLAGVVLGAGITVGYAANRDVMVSIPMAGIAASVGAALALGALAGVYPAVRASRIDPAEAVRR